MSEINFSELGYAEIQSLIKKLNSEKNKIAVEISRLNNTRDDLNRNRLYDISKEIENDDIPKEESKLRKVENQLFEINKYIEGISAKTEKIKKDDDVELTDAEAQYIIDEYSGLVDQYLKEKKYDQDRITELGDPKDEDGYNQLREAYGDLKDDEEKLMECTKVLNYAQCYLPKTI